VSDGSTRTDVEQGFHALPRQSAYVTNAVGPLFQRIAEGRLVLGLRVTDQHVNARGFAHGGLLTTVADIALGHALRVDRRGTLPLTVGITIDFFSPVPVGSWLEAHTEVHRVSARLGFSSAELFVGSELVARAIGTFSMSDQANSTASRPARNQ
jgi:uncharacterized protein (TIGR00369 family)